MTGDHGRPVPLAVAQLVRVDHDAVEDLVVDLDTISADLGHIGFQLVNAVEKVADVHAWSPHPTTVIADLVTVDPMWRGLRLGPAVVLFAAGVMRADSVALLPAALKTRLAPNGSSVVDWTRPRGDADALAKVRSAWRRAGFRKLGDDVVWRPEAGGPQEGAWKALPVVERRLDTTEGRAWYRRRLRRIESLT